MYMLKPCSLFRTVGLLSVLLTRVQCWRQLTMSAVNDQHTREYAPPIKAVKSIKPSYVAICTVVKDQNDDIREWVHYHHWLGVSKIYVYDHESTTPLCQDLDDWISAGVVDCVRLQNVPQPIRKKYFPKTGQGVGYNDCLKRVKNNGHEWAAFLDADEFIVLYKGNHHDLPKFLQKYTCFWQRWTQTQAQHANAAGVHKLPRVWCVQYPHQIHRACSIYQEHLERSQFQAQRRSLPSNRRSRQVQ
jgi:hypothetical protein